MKFPTIVYAPDDGGGNPAEGNPAAGNPAAANPAAGNPAAGNPAAGNPAAGNPAAGNPAAGNPAAGNPAAGNPAGGTPAAYRPDGLPDHLYGTSDKDTLDKIWKAYAGAREAISTAGEVPKDAAGYQFQVSDKAKPYAVDLDKDPFFSTTKELALKHKIGARAFQGFVGDLLDAMVDKSLVAEPFSPEKERAALVPEVHDPKQREIAADKIIRENLALVEAWKAQGLPVDAAEQLTSTLDRAAVNHLVDWIRDARGEQRPALNGAAVNAASEVELMKRMSDPRNDTSSPKYEPGFAAETTKMARAVWGE